MAMVMTVKPGFETQLLTTGLPFFLKTILAGIR